MKQLLHSEIQNQNHEMDIIIICDHIKDKRNIGMIFRLADAFGASKIVLVNEMPLEINQKIKRISRNTVRKIGLSQKSDMLNELEDYSNLGYMCVALEKCDQSMDISRMKWKSERKVALIIGNENLGISSHVLESINHVIHIPMFGTNTSMNLTHALAIGLFEITKPNS
tara:strand:- start:5585 stop:6091 length:507 start_codon:yes stop_codon:yes gene_type:complete